MRVHVCVYCEVGTPPNVFLKYNAKFLILGTVQRKAVKEIAAVALGLRRFFLGGGGGVKSPGSYAVVLLRYKEVGHDLMQQVSAYCRHRCFPGGDS